MNAPPTRRRWLQVSVGTLFWLTLVLALVLAFFAERRGLIRAKAEVRTMQAKVQILKNRIDETQRKSLQAEHQWVNQIKKLEYEHDLEMRRLKSQQETARATGK